ncbi:MAG: hypothetical protein ACLTSZ_04230 [Lachnospiraceae bacterium]
MKKLKSRFLNYEELWAKKDDLFPHLCFCPSVEMDLQKLENYYLSQIVQKLEQLEQHCAITEQKNRYIGAEQDNR